MVVVVRVPGMHLLCGVRHAILSVETINWLFFHRPLAVCLAVAEGRCVVGRAGSRRTLLGGTLMIITDLIDKGSSEF